MGSPDFLMDNQIKGADLPKNIRNHNNEAFNAIVDKSLNELLSSGEKSNGAPLLVFPSPIKDSQDLPSEDLKNTHIVKNFGDTRNFAALGGHFGCD